MKVELFQRRKRRRSRRWVAVIEFPWIPLFGFVVLVALLAVVLLSRALDAQWFEWSTIDRYRQLQAHRPGVEKAYGLANLDLRGAQGQILSPQGKARALADVARASKDPDAVGIRLLGELQRLPRSVDLGPALLVVARAQLSKRHHKSAILYARQALASTTAPDVMSKALLIIGDVHCAEMKKWDAMIAYERAKALGERKRLWRLARYFEEQSRWQQAHEAWWQWSGEAHPCHSEPCPDVIERQTGLARTRFHLGDQQTSLDRLWNLAVEHDAKEALSDFLTLGQRAEIPLELQERLDRLSDKRQQAIGNMAKAMREERYIVRRPNPCTPHR